MPIHFFVSLGHALPARKRPSAETVDHHNWQLGGQLCPLYLYGWHCGVLYACWGSAVRNSQLTANERQRLWQHYATQTRPQVLRTGADTDLCDRFLLLWLCSVDTERSGRGQSCARCCARCWHRNFSARFPSLSSSAGTTVHPRPLYTTAHQSFYCEIKEQQSSHSTSTKAAVENSEDPKISKEWDQQRICVVCVQSAWGARHHGLLWQQQLYDAVVPPHLCWTWCGHCRREGMVLWCLPLITRW